MPAPLLANTAGKRADTPASSSRGLGMALLIFIVLLAGVIGGSVWLYRRSVASMEANAQQKQDEENAFRRRVRAAHAANEAAAREAETTPASE